MFLNNVWYAAWWSDELKGDGLSARMIAGIPIVFWRMSRANPVPVPIGCPHRHAPLSRGRRVAGGIQCGYHGISFDHQGRCLANPHGAAVAALSVRPYPVVEKHKILWIWMGLANEATIASDSRFELCRQRTDTAYSRGFLPTAAGHQLIEDNILDLTHADYLHATTLWWRLGHPLCGQDRGAGGRHRIHRVASER